MNTISAQATVVTVGAGVALLAVIDAATHARPPTARRLLAVTVATFGLSAVANGAPDLAGRVALLWGATTVIVSGGPAITAVSKGTTSTGSPRASSTTPPPRYVTA